MDLALADRIEIHNVKYYLLPELWEEFSCDGIDLTTVTWNETKFLSDDGTTLHVGMNNLPTTSGGIYVFYVKCHILPNMSNFLMYIGRAKITETHNLKVRCRKYFYEYNNEKSRPKIARLVNRWGKYLYLRYIELTDNNLIERLEASLINSIRPPSNDNIPEKRIRDAVKAF